MNFFDYLSEVERLKKAKDYEKAWALSNEAVINLHRSKEEMWYMVYYQMADILAREKRWFEALEKMGYVIYYLKGLGGITHEKFVIRLLGKLQAQDKLSSYLDLCEKTKPELLADKLHKLLDES